MLTLTQFLYKITYCVDMHVCLFLCHFSTAGWSLYSDDHNDVIKKLINKVWENMYLECESLKLQLL